MTKENEQTQGDTKEKQEKIKPIIFYFEKLRSENNGE